MKKGGPGLEGVLANLWYGILYKEHIMKINLPGPDPNPSVPWSSHVASAISFWCKLKKKKKVNVAFCISTYKFTPLLIIVATWLNLTNLLPHGILEYFNIVSIYW